MSSELQPVAMAHDREDSLLYMAMRRAINEDYAEVPVNFNTRGLEAGRLLLGRSLTSNDIIVDIGSSSGQMIADAAEQTDTRAQLVCVEPDGESVRIYGRIVAKRHPNLHFLEATGERLPLQANVAQGATLHNVIFRSRDPRAMLEEVKRVVVPGGFVALSSNSRGHAVHRHNFERQLAERVMELTGERFALPRPPAEGRYIEDLPRLIKTVGGLAIMNDLYVSQESRVIITRGQPLDDYLESLKFSAANTPLSAHGRSVWRQQVEAVARPLIEDVIDHCSDKERPYFSDTIKRGMFVLQNSKTA